ncbi:MAG: sugar transferase, partial [Nitrolancea sp.]
MMNGNRSRHALTFALLLSDAIAIAAALFIASKSVTIFGTWQDPLSHGWLAAHRWAWLLAIPLWLSVFALTHLYRKRNLFLGPQEYAKVFSGCTSGVMGMALASILLPGPANVSAAWLLITWALSIFLVGLSRFGFRRGLRRLQQRGLFISRAIIVGVNEQTKTMARLFRSAAQGVSIVGFIDDDIPAGTMIEEQIRVIGSPRNVRRLVRELQVDQLIIVHDALAWESFRDILEEAAFDHDGLEVKILPSFHEILTTGVEIQHTGFMPLLALDRVRITGFDAFLKNVLDYGLSLATVLVLAPAMALLALLLPLLGPGPVLQRNRAYGRKGMIFSRLSFNLRHRSATQPGWRGGAVRLIRRCRLEMWPQLFNVLQGQMSWVGPRPVYVGSEERVEPWLANLVTVKPGISGPWAIAASARGSLASEMRGTMYYVRSYSIWLDVQILFQTVRNLLRFHPDQLRLSYLERISPEDLGYVRQLARRLTTDVPAAVCCISIWDEERHSLAVASVNHRGDDQDGLAGDVSIDINLLDAPLHRTVMEEGHVVTFERRPNDPATSWPELPIKEFDEVVSVALLPLSSDGPTAGVVLL